jgi:outer membrane biosynthesis protein TonB
MIDLAALVSSPLPANTELPEGTFNYPAKQSGNRLLWLFALLATGALGFAAVVFVVPKLTADQSALAPPPTTHETVAGDVHDAGSELATAPDAAEGDGEVRIDVTPPDPHRPVVAPGGAGTRPIPGRPTSGQGSSGPVTRPTTATTTATTSASGGGDEGGEPPVSPPITASDCDEVACVLSKYNRPCCAKYKPAESDLKPRAGGVPTELDKVMVRAGIEKVKPRVVACGERSADKGTVRIRVAVKPDGDVSEASVVETPSQALGDCVASALRKAQFGKSINGGTFTYPFVF